MTENITVRKARRAEIPTIAAVQCSAWQSAFSDIITDATMKKYTDAKRCAEIIERAFDTGHLYIAGINNKACGELFWRRLDTRAAEIVALHTLRRVWGRGVGRALMDAAMRDIAAESIGAAVLWVFKANIRARKFYEKYGFAPTGGERVSIYDRAPEIQYRRIL